MKDEILQFVQQLSYFLKQELKKNLVSIVLYGSSVRGNLRNGSDIDLLVVLEKADTSYYKRTKYFAKLINRLEDIPKALDKLNLYLAPSFLIFVKKEIKIHPSILLDIVQEGIIIYDKGDFFKDEIKKIKERLEILESKRLNSPQGYYWVLKPNIKPGEEIII